MARDLAGTIGPMAHASALRAEIEEAEPDDAYVARQRAEFESHMRWDHPDYRYPAHLTGPSAASYPPPPEHGAGGGAMTPDEAIEAAELVEAETRYLHQLAREAYEAGHADGYRAGYRQADADQAARWNQAARAVTDGPAHAELEERRWGPGGRAHFADPRPGDFPGRGSLSPRPGAPRSRARNGGDGMSRHTRQTRRCSRSSRERRTASCAMHLTSGWYKQAAVYPSCPSPGRKPKRCLDRPQRSTPRQLPGPAHRRMEPRASTAEPEQREPEAGQ